MATRQWAVTTDGTFDFNNPANWKFGTVPGPFDIAQFDTGSFDTVTGNATVGEILVTHGAIELTGSYTISGAYPTELAAGSVVLMIDSGASISGNGNIVVNGGELLLGGTLAGASATFANGALELDPGSVFAVGSVSLSGDSTVGGSVGDQLETLNALQISGSISEIGTALVITGAVSGAGSLNIIRSVELDCSNSYSGGTTLSSGVLALGNANALGTGGLTITGGELLATADLEIPNSVTMSGNFTIAAAHNQTLIFPAGTDWTLNASPGEVITFGAPGQDGTVTWFAGTSSSIINSPGTYTVAVQAGTYVPDFAGLLGNDQHTIVAAGATLDIHNGLFLVNDLTGAGHVTGGSTATLSVNGGNFNGVIDGSMHLRVTNSSSLILSGTNLSSTMTIDPGSTLTLGAGGTTGSVADFITNNGTLAINRSDNFVVNHVEGSGRLQQMGPGNTWLGTDLSYTGGTVISGGTLIVNDPAALGAGGLTINGGELLEGLTGTINNALTIGGSSTIAAAPGQTLTLATSSLTWTADTGDVVTFGDASQNGTVAFGASASVISHPGTYTVLIRAGTLRPTPGGGVVLGNDQHTIIRPAGTLDAGGSALFVHDLTGGGRVTNSGASVGLNVHGGNFHGIIDGPLSLFVVDANPLTLSGTNTYTGSTTIFSGATLILGAGGTTGSVPGAVDDDGILAINRSDSFVVNNVSGTGQLQQIGPGVTTLGTGLNYTGGTLISAGTLVVNSAAALGSGGLTINGGELLAGASETINNALTMSGSFTIAASHGQTLTTASNGWTLNDSPGEVITFGAAGQDGTVAFGNSGLTTINTPNLYTVLVQAGTLIQTADGGLGALLFDDQRTAIRPGATLDAAGLALWVNDLHGAGHIINSGAFTDLTINGGAFNGVISGGFTVFVQGALVLAGNNAFDGNAIIESGATLTLGNGGTTGSVTSNFPNSGTLEFRHSNIFVEAGAISGSGNVVQDGPGTTVLTASNSYSGGTFVAGGTLEAQIPGAIGSGAVTFLAGAASTFRIDGTTMPTNGILNFAAGDIIDLANITANGWSYSGGMLNLFNNGAPVAQLTVSTAFSHPLFALSGDGGSGTNIVLEPPPPQDFNADNMADLVFQTPNNAFLGALSTGAGFTTPQLWVQQGGSFMAGEAQYADVNGDRRVDLIYQGLDNRFFVSLSTGSAFTAPVQWVQHGGTFVAGQAQYADVNGDGRADLIMQSGDNGFYVSLSTGSGFTTPALWVQHGGAFTAGEAQYADVNGDGRADLIMQSGDNGFYVSLSTGSGFTTPALWVQHGGTFTAGEAQYADLNGDGRADLIFQGLDNRFFVSLSTGSGFTTPVQWVQHGGSFTAGEAQYADVNGDHLADLIFQGLDNRFFVSLSTGSGFTTPTQWMQHGGAFSAGQAQYADVNGDGKFDLLFQGADNKEYLSLSNGSSFGAATLVANFGAYGSFQPGTLHV